MGEIVYQLTVTPKPDADGHDFDVGFARVRDDGRRRWNEPIPLVEPRLSIDPAWIDAHQSARCSAPSLNDHQDPITLAWHRSGAALSTALPPEILDRLETDVADHHSPRLLLSAQGDAAALPWNLLGRGDDLHFWAGNASLVRRPAGTHDGEPGAPTTPRILLVLLDATQAPGVFSAAPHVAELVAGIRNVQQANAHWSLQVATCTPKLKDLATLPPIAGADDLLRLIRTGDYSILHFVGHSDAQHANPDPRGATGFQLRFGETVGADQLANALGDASANIRLVVAQACDIQDYLAERLLAAPAVRQIAATGAFIDPDSCVPWALGFYEGLADSSSVGQALERAAKELRNSHSHLIPLLNTWSRDEQDLEFAGPDERLVQRYLRLLAGRVDRLQGRFQGVLEHARLSRLYIELAAQVGNDGSPTPERLELLERLPEPLRSGKFRVETLLDVDTDLAFLLRGKPGAGKSTTLRMMALHVAQQRRLRSAVPVILSLPRWMATPDQDLVCAGLAPFGHVLGADLDKLAELLRSPSRPLLALHDGFDELNQTQRAVFQDRLAQLRDDRPQDRHIVATRHYGESTSVDGLVDLDLQDLDEARALDLLTNLLRAGGLAEAEALAQAMACMEQTAAKGRAWKLLTRVPLFVTLIGELLLDGQQPAESRFEFFVQVFDRLCHSAHRGADLGRAAQAPGKQDPDDDAIPGALLEREDDDPLAFEAAAAVPSPEFEGVLDLLSQLALSMTQDAVIERPPRDLAALLQAPLEHPAQELKDVAAAVPGLRIRRHAETAGRLLREVCRRTMILGPAGVLPVDEGDSSLEGDSGDEPGQRSRVEPWRFWHRSFQEALSAWAMLRRLRAGEDAASVLGELRTSDGSDALPEDFWVEVLALVLDALVADELDREIRNRTDLAAKVLTLLRGTESRTLARAVVLRLDRCTPRLWQIALDAPQAGPRDGKASDDPEDGAVKTARHSYELPVALRARLEGRHPLYAELWPSVARVDPGQFAADLSRRAQAVEDPGELYFIDHVAAAMRRGAPGVGSQSQTEDWLSAAAQLDAAVEARLDSRQPSWELWQGQLVPIPGGVSCLGSEHGRENERPPHRVRLETFHLGRSHVTVAQYREFWPTHRMALDKKPTPLIELRGLGRDSDEPVDELPVTNVSWYAAQMFCRWMRHHWRNLVEKIGLAECIDHDVALPTEAQWEHAVRADRAGSDEYWCGDDSRLEAAAWFATNADGRTHAVGRKPDSTIEAHPFGLVDPVGNAWCWCRDAYDHDYYRALADREPVAEPLRLGASAAWRVVRGGSFVIPAHGCRSACRYWSHPAVANSNRGFRVALVPAAAAPQRLSAIEFR